MNHDLDLIKQKQKKFILRPDVPKPFSIWRHYKGEIYLVGGIVMRESTEEFEVCYSSIKNPLLCPWSRPISEWIELVKNGDGDFVTRFSHVRDHITESFTCVQHCELEKPSQQ